MIYCSAHNFLFIKSRKTAGTSVEIYLSKFCSPDDIITRVRRSDEALRRELGYQAPTNFLLARNSRLLDIQAKYALTLYGLFGARSLHNSLVGNKKAFKRTIEADSSGRPWIKLYNHIELWRLQSILNKAILERSLKFTIVRNPFDRAISLFFWRHRHNPEEIADLGKDALRRKVADFVARMPPPWLTDWRIYGAGDELLVDRVVRYERLGEDLADALTACGIRVERPVRLPVAKGSSRTDRSHYSELLDAASTERIKQAAKKEISTFGYRFESG